MTKLLKLYHNSYIRTILANSIKKLYQWYSDVLVSQKKQTMWVHIWSPTCKGGMHAIDTPLKFLARAKLRTTSMT